MHAPEKQKKNVSVMLDNTGPHWSTLFHYNDSSPVSMVSEAITNLKH